MLAVSDPRRRLVSFPALLAGGIAAAVDAGYLVLIRSEGNNEWTDVAPIALEIGLAASAAAVAAFLESPAVRVALLTLAAGVLFAWTILGAFSIGVFLAPAAVLAWLAASHAGYLLRPSVVTASAVSVVVAAFAIVVFQLAVAQ
ncbi:MAG: hypothetical protein M3M94_04760 [Actinomycetota bacterium]|nr:hypothetical protein [Actinomycetota bacterium]